MASLRCLFLVQGEGRGHLTQALALQRLLHAAGHRVVGALVGRSAPRAVPGFFRDRLEVPLTFLDSPHFVLDGARRGLRLGRTVLHNAARTHHFRRALHVLDDHMDRLRPDVVVNFFEPLGGVYYRWRRPAVPMVSIGHQYLLFDPAFPFPAGHRLHRRALLAFTRLTAAGAARRLALSFYPRPDLPAEGVTVVPPLLRGALFEQPLDLREDFLLAYVLNDGYAEAITRWQAAHPETRIHCFWDRADAAEVTSPQPGLTFHRLRDEKFLSMMARCSGLVCTAGFESVCEALYLGKPVLMVPVAGHFEQQCNAQDAVRAGAGVTAATFDIDRLLAHLPAYRPNPGFRAWVETAETRFLDAIETAAWGRSVSLAA